MSAVCVAAGGVRSPLAPSMELARDERARKNGVGHDYGYKLAERCAQCRQRRLGWWRAGVIAPRGVPSRVLLRCDGDGERTTINRAAISMMMATLRARPPPVLARAPGSVRGDWTGWHARRRWSPPPAVSSPCAGAVVARALAHVAPQDDARRNARRGAGGAEGREPGSARARGRVPAELRRDRPARRRQPAQRRRGESEACEAPPCLPAARSSFCRVRVAPGAWRVASLAGPRCRSRRDLCVGRISNHVSTLVALFLGRPSPPPPAAPRVAPPPPSARRDRSCGTRSPRSRARAPRRSPSPRRTAST